MSEINNETYAQFVRGTDDDDNISNNALRVTISAGAGNDNIWNGGNMCGVSGYYLFSRFGHDSSINAGTGDDTIINMGDRTTILGGGGNDIIESWDSAYLDAGSWYCGRACLIDGGAGNDSIVGFGLDSTILGGDGSDTINNHYGSISTINGGKGNDLIFNNAYNVTLNGGKGNDTISLGSDAKNTLIKYSAGDGNDKITGFNATSTLRIGDGKGTYSTVTSGSNIIVTVGKGKISLIGAANLDEFHIDGASVQKITNSTKSTVDVDADIKFIDASKRTNIIQINGNKLANSIVGGTKSDTIYGGYGADTIEGGKGSDLLSGDNGNDKIFGGEGADSIYGGKGNDSINGGDGNDTLSGGKGRDMFVYSGGNDVITDYVAGQDSILAASGTISKASVKGSNVIFTIGSGTLTVKNGKGKSLAITDSNGKSYSAVVDAANSMKVVLTNTASPVTLDAAIKNVDASKRTKALNLTANSMANSIVGGSEADSLDGGAGNDTLRGGKGNDTLAGGKGNDSLWGDAGNDTFLYSNADGNDVIYGFEDNDLLQITGTFSDPKYNGSAKSIVFKVGTGSVTLKDFGSTTLFHVNDDTYQLSGSKLVKK